MNFFWFRLPSFTSGHPSLQGWVPKGLPRIHLTAQPWIIIDIYIITTSNCLQKITSMFLDESLCVYEFSSSIGLLNVTNFCNHSDYLLEINFEVVPTTHPLQLLFGRFFLVYEIRNDIPCLFRPNYVWTSMLCMRLCW